MFIGVLSEYVSVLVSDPGTRDKDGVSCQVGAGN